VRALFESTVWASVLKADSTALTVVRDRIGPTGISTGDGSGIAWRGGGAAFASVNSRSSCGSILLNEVAAGGGAGAGFGSGSAISSVSSNTSASAWGGLTSSSAAVSSSRLASIASMSSWLLLASAAGGGGAGAGFEAGTGAAATGLAVAC